MTRIDQPKKPMKKSERTAKKNTSNGTLAKNNVDPKRVNELFVSIDAVSNFLVY